LLGEFGQVLADVLDDFLFGLSLDEAFGAVFGNKTKASGEGENEQGPTAGFGEAKLNQSARIQILEVSGSVLDQQLAPGFLARAMTEFERGAEAFLEMLAAIHPTGGFSEGSLAPAADDETGNGTQKCRAGRSRQSPIRDGRNLVDSESHEPEQRPDKYALPEAAQCPLPAAAARRFFESRFDILEFTHWFIEHCHFSKCLTSEKCSNFDRFAPLPFNQKAPRRSRGAKIRATLPLALKFGRGRGTVGRRQRVCKHESI
jgi:hypothetical protein